MSGRGRPPKLAGQEESVIAMYLGGATIGDLEEHFGCSDTPILRILDAAGIERRRGRPSAGGTRPPKKVADPFVPDVRAPGYTPDPDPRSDEEVGQVRIPSTGPRASRAVTDQVFRRDGFRCRMCGAGNRLTVEFMIPPEQGGNPRNPDDLRTVCAQCSIRPVDKPGLLKRIFNR